MSDPVTWLDVLMLIAVYVVASLAHKAICSILTARETLRELGPETADEAAPERQDGATADPSRAVCNDPAASSALNRGHRTAADMIACADCNPEWPACTDPECRSSRWPHAHPPIRGGV